ncbi:MAG TPA: hypothetical protein VEW25_06100 [Allosphingosinicella sp.]|nr:hypothetical protein [Allosphingosinicella sp.]
MSWYDFKDLIGDYTGLERDALHIHAALFLYLIAMGLFRQSRRSRIPWLIVFFAELANEGHDVYYNWGEDPDWILEGAVKDLWNTLLWPTVLLLVGRYTDWFKRRPRPQAEPEFEAPA